MGVSVRDVGIGIALAAIMLQGWDMYKEVNRKALVDRVTRSESSGGKEKLKEHTNVFVKKEVIQITPRLYMAIGYALANSMMIVGKDGVVIVDVTESIASARQVNAAFREITNLPVKGIIYTHNHPDHVMGAKAFVREGEDPPVIWAHQDLLKLVQRQYYVGAIFFKRAYRQFGILIPKTNIINAGIGINVNLDEENVESGMIKPNKFMSGIEKDISIAGIDMKLVHIPGETEDQIGVWLPGDRAFLCADDVYKAFPNLYAIRGTPHRDLLHWSTSIDRILSYKPEHLVPSHTRNIEGEEKIRTLLTDYRDAIQYVHDQTVRYMNKGYLPDEIAAVVKLPENLATHPFLLEFYGTVKWSVKGVFNGYMGWFSGDPVDLSTLTPNEMAQRTVHLAGGVEKVTTAAEEALSRGEWQWGLVLSSYVLRVDNTMTRAREVKAKCLMALGERQISANGRNYYITSAMEELGEISTEKSVANRREAVIRSLPMLNLFSMMQMRWDAESCGVVNRTLQFIFTDTKQTITLTLRNSVVLISDKPPATTSPSSTAAAAPTIKVTTSSQVWRNALVSSLTGLTSFATGDIKVEGGLAEFKNVLACFDKN